MEIYQNCNIFNDGAWEPLKDSDVREENIIRLVDGEPIIFGSNKDKCVVRDSSGQISVTDVATADPKMIITHDAKAEDPGLAFALSRLDDSRSLANTPIGVFRDVTRPSYDRMAQEQLAKAVEDRGPGDLQSLLRGSDTWEVS